MTFPESGLTSPEIMFSIVVLPEPLLPITDINSPFSATKEKSENNAFSSTVFGLKTFEMFSSLSIGVFSFLFDRHYIVQNKRQDK